MAVDYRLQDRMARAQAQNAGLIGSETVEIGGGGGDSGGMDGIIERVARVEGRLDAIEERLGRVETCLDGMDNRLRLLEVAIGELSGRLTMLVESNRMMASKLPSWWQMPAMVGAIIAMLAVVKRFGLL